MGRNLDYLDPILIYFSHLTFQTQTSRWLFIVANNYLHLDIVFQNAQREKYPCFNRISLRYFLLKERNSEKNNQLFNDSLAAIK